MMLWTEWWVWMAGALALATLEVIVPGYIFLGFALGAAMLGFLILLGVNATGLALTLVIFAGFSLVSYVGLRRILGVRQGQVKVWERDIND